MLLVASLRPSSPIPISHGRQPEDVCTSCPSTRLPPLYLSPHSLPEEHHRAARVQFSHKGNSFFSQFALESPSGLYSMLLICQLNSKPPSSIAARAWLNTERSTTFYEAIMGWKMDLTFDNAPSWPHDHGRLAVRTRGQRVSQSAFFLVSLMTKRMKKERIVYFFLIAVSLRCCIHLVNSKSCLNAVKMHPAMTEKMTRWLSTQDFSDYLKRIQRVLMIQ